MKSICSFFLIVTLFAVACNTPASSSAIVDTKVSGFNIDSVKAGIAASNQLFSESFAKADSAMFLDRYTSDAMLLAPNMPALNGSAGLLGFYNAAIAQMGVKGITLNIIDVFGGGDYATEQGTYDLLGADNKSLEKGKYLVLWKKTDAGWKMYRDIFNSDNPPSPATK